VWQGTRNPLNTTSDPSADKVITVIEVSNISCSLYTSGKVLSAVLGLSKFFQSRIYKLTPVFPRRITLKAFGGKELAGLLPTSRPSDDKSR
jgi:hypothetical protein